MKKIVGTTAAIIAFSITIISFISFPGGEGYEIYLNNKVVVHRFGNEMNDPANLSLAGVSANDKLIVKYHHCGKQGKNRVLTIKDQQNYTLKEFRYTDPSAASGAMEIDIRFISGINKTGRLKLYYTSSELPGGRFLASISR